MQIMSYIWKTPVVVVALLVGALGANQAGWSGAELEWRADGNSRRMDYSCFMACLDDDMCGRSSPGAKNSKTCPVGHDTNPTRRGSKQ